MSKWQPWDVGSLPPKDADIEYKRGLAGDVHTCNVADVPPWWNIHNVFWRPINENPPVQKPVNEDDTKRA